MRVIAGEARGRRLEALPGTEITRPTMDQVKEAMFSIVLLDPPFHTGTLEKILPGVDKCLAPGGIVICESETGLVLPAEVGGMTLKKQYKYGKVLLWKYGKPRQSAGEGDAE